MYTTKTVGSQTTSPWIPLDNNQAAFNVSVAVAVTGTLTYTVQFTLDNIQDPTVTPVAFDVSALTGKTVAASTSLRSSVKAVRLNVTAYTSGSATIGVRQGTSWDGVDFATSSGSVVLFQCGIPFWLPPGDGGANGLSFTGTRGVFTLSAAAPMANCSAMFASGGYTYLPAGAGGLASGGLYWFTMSSDTDGEIFNNVHVPGSGVPKFYESPTAFANLTTGRITQSTAEITATSFTIPGGCMGPHGKIVLLQKLVSSSTAGTKSFRLIVGSQSWFRSGFTTSLNDQLLQISRSNMGVETRQIGNRTNSTGSAWDCGSSSTTFTGDVTTVDTSVDQIATFTMQLTTTNTDSVILVPMQVKVEYGAGA